MQTVLIVLFVIGLIVAVVGAGLGYFLGWFDFWSRNDKGRAYVTLLFDRNKMAADEARVTDQIHDLRHKVVDRIAVATRKLQD